jgi:ferredoxin
MKIKLKINNKINYITIGEPIVDSIDYLSGAEFSCLKGICGKCLVEVLTGQLGALSQKEKDFLSLMDLEINGKYRLLCQGYATANANVRKY